jgi:prefoldin subunit 5
VAAAPPGPAHEAVTVGEIAAMKANIDQLQREMAELRETVERLRAALGGDS